MLHKVYTGPRTVHLHVTQGMYIHLVYIEQYYITLYRMSQELMSLVQDLIPELILSQKCHIHMGQIHNGSEVMSL
jgi:hypothetical protein